MKVTANRFPPHLRPDGRAICVNSSAKDASLQRIHARPSRSSSSPRHASPRAAEARGCGHPYSPRNADGNVSFGAFPAARVSACGAVPSSIQYVYGSHPCPPTASVHNSACPSTVDVSDNDPSISAHWIATLGAHRAPRLTHFVPRTSQIQM